jgi:hypothetical protein
MSAAQRAGAAYFLAVFIVAFAVGAFRVSVVAPRYGAVTAVSLEAPLILAVSWFASRWACARFTVSRSMVPRLAMGAVAFALLMAAELALSVIAFGRPVDAYLESFMTPEGLIGLGSQVIFGVIPAMQALRTTRAGE